MRPIQTLVFAAFAASSIALAQDAPTPENPAPSTPNAPIDLPDADAAQGARQLEALVISVTGRGGRWRAPDSDQWNPVAVDDVLPAGAQIDTGLRGEVALRVGRNATLLISSASSVTLAEIEEADGRLVTRALLTKGAADFKVDHVGLENDFVVITPSSTLAVKGTGFRVIHGPMRGTEIEGMRTNMVNAIEVGYFNVRTQVRMSGAAQSSTNTPNPALAALNQTVAPPPSTSPADPSPADAQGTSQTQTVRNTQSVAVETAAFVSLLTSLAGNQGGGGVGIPPVNPGYGGRPGSGPVSGGNATPGTPLPGRPRP